MRVYLMEFVWAKQEAIEASGESPSKIFTALVRITDLEQEASNILAMLFDQSWIDSLEVVGRTSFLARAKPTIEKMAAAISANNPSDLSEDFGEYLVSESARQTLQSKFKHSLIPLAELIKEKSLGNPGFDFHAESTDAILIFGEAKYSGSSTTYTKALEQIVKFIGQSKDDMELSLLEVFATPTSVKNYTAGFKGFAAAFSIHADKPETIFANALKKDEIKELAQYSELYLIGVVVDA